MPELKIAYITSLDPEDKHAWSGTTHYLYKALQQHSGKVTVLGPAAPGLTLFFAKVFHAISLYIFGKRFDYRHSKMMSKAYARIFDAKLKNEDYDIIVSPGGVTFTASLKTQIPVVLVLDRAIGNAFDYHKALSNLWPFSKKQSLETDRLAMEKAALVLFASEWAAQYAISGYGLPKEKIHVLPFGANLDQPPEKQKVLAAKDYTKCRLLLLGTYWEHKGADIAVNTLNMLREKGIDAHLTVAGCTAPADFRNEHVTLIPFIDKNSAEGRKKLEELFLSHTFFILPTRFEAYGIVFCEASAYGLISLGTRTGGVPSVITEGVNGFLVDREDNGEEYARIISEVFKDENRMKQLSLSARNHYEEKLNWNSWAKEFNSLAAALLSKHAQS